MGGGSGGPREAGSAPAPLHAPRPPPSSGWPSPSTAQPARRGNPLQSQAYVHRAGSVPSPGGPRALCSSARCLRSVGATPSRCRPTGKAIGSRWTAGCLSSDFRLGAWRSAWGQGTRGAGQLAQDAPLQEASTRPPPPHWTGNPSVSIARPQSSPGLDFHSRSRAPSSVPGSHWHCLGKLPTDWLLFYQPGSPTLWMVNRQAPSLQQKAELSHTLRLPVAQDLPAR